MKNELSALVVLLACRMEVAKQLRVITDQTKAKSSKIMQLYDKLDGLYDKLEGLKSAEEIERLLNRVEAVIGYIKALEDVKAELMSRLIPLHKPEPPGMSPRTRGTDIHRNLEGSPISRLVETSAHPSECDPPREDY